MNTTADQRIVILGGGLAGLSLALQLRQTYPQLDVLVLERRNHPVPEATHKVGESTVEIGAHYFAEVLGLRDHMKGDQLKKFGFRFFWSEGKDGADPQFDQVTELGAGTFLSTPAWQLDRGIFENALGGFAREAGARFVDGAMVKTVDLEKRGALHTVEWEQAGERHSTQARWVVDASGRAGLLKKKLDLAQANDHDANAVWFRMEGRIDVNDWSDDPAWRARCNPPNRWLSTNHLVGEGYWVWLIPLASGSHSVGIVCDAELHPIARMNTFERAMEWLHDHQPQLWRVLDARREGLQDFGFFKHFSYGCKQVWSGHDRWALTGEAGLFLDPFYSPGSDFIGISNTYITTLIGQDLGGKPVGMYADIYQSIYQQLYRNMLPIYNGQYGLFRDAQVMPVKVIWDYAYYWGAMCPLFFQHKLTDLPAMAKLQKAMERVQLLGDAVQQFLRDWGDANRATHTQHNRRQMLDQADLPWFAEWNRRLTERVEGPAFDAQMAESMAMLDALVVEMVDLAQVWHPELDASGVLKYITHSDAAARAAERSLLFPQLHTAADAHRASQREPAPA